MAGAVDHPLLDHRLPSHVNVQRTAVGVTTGNLAFHSVCLERRNPRRLSNHRVAITWVDRGIPVAMENNGRNDLSLRFGWQCASRTVQEAVAASPEDGPAAESAPEPAEASDARTPTLSSPVAADAAPVEAANAEEPAEATPTGAAAANGEAPAAAAPRRARRSGGSHAKPSGGSAK